MKGTKKSTCFDNFCRDLKVLRQKTWLGNYKENLVFLKENDFLSKTDAHCKNFIIFLSLNLYLKPKSQYC